MTATNQSRSRDQTLVLVLAWLAVGAPLLWGVAQTVNKAMALFGSG
jgi:hypothetical protein